MKNKLGIVLENKGISQTWLASKLGLNRMTVGNWVSQRSQPKEYTLKYIAQLIGVSYNDLIDVDYEN